MKAEDITDEMLVALADGELTEPNPDEVYKIVVSDDKLLVKYSNYVETGFLLKEAFSSQINNTDNVSSEENNVVSFSDAKEKKSFKENFLNTRSLLQMAAALMIGVISGPVLVNNMQNSGFDVGFQANEQKENKHLKHMIEVLEPLQRSGFENRYATRALEEPEVDMILKSSAGEIVFPGMYSDLNKPFKLELLSELDGKVTIKEILEDGSHDIWMDNIEIKRNVILSLPPIDFFKLTEVRDTLALEIELKSGDRKSSKLFIFGYKTTSNETENIKAN